MGRNILYSWIGKKRANILKMIILGIFAFCILFQQPYNAFYGKFIPFTYKGIRIFVIPIVAIFVIIIVDTWNS